MKGKLKSNITVMNQYALVFQTVMGLLGYH